MRDDGSRDLSFIFGRVCEPSYWANKNRSNEIFGASDIHFLIGTPDSGNGDVKSPGRDKEILSGRRNENRLIHQDERDE
jgi:hypothetical protein